ncbi:MAG TPA: 6-phosphogluconolactonase [Bacteroidales bacterium]|jgi:6-phosphogluconolactonase|nr:6-phosphogluconolactonase [Bacteroidales bacterium]
MKTSVRVFENAADVAAKLADEIVMRIRAAADEERSFSIALSGGSTPELLYSFLGDEFRDSVPWEFVHLFWGDERCVPPGNPDSNYGMVKRSLIDKIGIDAAKIHRIFGENDPEGEAKRYSGEILSGLPSRDGMPVFDLVLLGLGSDGHTASIFPGNMDLLASDSICAATVHPETGQKRITITSRVINNAEAVVFMVTGENKAGIVREIINNEPGSEKYPASHIKPVYGSLDWYLDGEAGQFVQAIHS